jgi:hypothetical protein
MKKFTGKVLSREDQKKIVAGFTEWELFRCYSGSTGPYYGEACAPASNPGNSYCQACYGVTYAVPTGNSCGGSGCP